VFTKENLSGDGGGAILVDRLVGEGAQFQDGGVYLLHYATEGEKVEHSLALVLIDDINEILTGADEHDAVPRNHQLSGG
jgi:hypothetical protein